MPQVTTASSLADIVRAVPDSRRTLESFGLDYCCGGQRTLADALPRARRRPQRLSSSV